jgi:uncharacterized protein YxjI
MGEVVPSSYYVELFEISDMAGFAIEDMAGEIVQSVMGDFMKFEDDPEFIIAHAIDPKK